MGPVDFEGVDCFVHLAAHTPNVPYDTLENCLYWNVMVPLQVFRNAHSGGVKRFIVAGSCFEYGKSGDRDEFNPIDTPLEPIATYPVSKETATVVFRGLTAELDLKLSIHRIFQGFSEGESENRISPLLRKAALAGKDYDLTAGEQIRDFIDMSEVASQLLLSTEASQGLNAGTISISNLSTGAPRTIAEFSSDWWSRWKAAGKLNFGVFPCRDGEVMRFVPLA